MTEQQKTTAQHPGKLMDLMISCCLAQCAGSEQTFLPVKENLGSLCEMETLAGALGFLYQGKVGQAGDLLTQRFLAVETATVRSWDSAKYMELLTVAALGRIVSIR
eukprot:1950889-Amphidinium_carterae.1